MTRDGWIPLHRKFLDPNHPIGGGAPFCPWMAWLDLCAGAMHKTGKRTVRGGGTFVQPRGVVLVAQRKLADRWRWSRKQVRGFIERLESEGMITFVGWPNDTVNCPAGSLWKICEYETYAVRFDDESRWAQGDSGAHLGPTSRSHLGAHLETDDGAHLGNTDAEKPSVAFPHAPGPTSEGDPGPTSGPTSERWAGPKKNKDIHPSFPRAREGDDEDPYLAKLRDYVGDAADRFGAVEDRSGLWAQTLWGLYGPDGTADMEYRSLDPERRSKALAQAMDEYCGLGERFIPKLFRGVLRRTVGALLRPVTADGLTASQEEQRLQHARNEARERAEARPVVVERSGGLALPEPELVAWADQQDAPTKVEIQRTADRLIGVLDSGGIPITEVARTRVQMQAISNVYRQLQIKPKGFQSVGEILGAS